MNHWLKRRMRRLRPTRIFVVESWFLQDLVRHLNRGPDEDIVYVTGIELGCIRILSRMCHLELCKQSPVGASTTARAAASVLEDIWSHGSKPSCMAHSHPGGGVLGTFPSMTDRRYLGSIQKAGAEVIGVITTRDGHVRFWTVHMAFRVVVQGNNYRKVGRYVYRVDVAQAAVEKELLPDTEDEATAIA